MAWDWKEELAKIGLGKTLTGLLLLVGFLFVVMWRETLFAKWTLVAEGLSKPALMAALGLALVAVGLEALAIACLLYVLFRKQPAPPSATAADPIMLKRYGVLWDKDENPHCPVDKTYMPFFSHGVVSDHECDYLRCPACHATIPLWDSNLGGLALHDAKKFIQQDRAFGRISD